MAERNRQVLPDDPVERFKMQAGTRTNGAIQACDLIGKCANPANKYTEAQVAKIEAALTAAVATNVKKLRDGLKGIKPSQTTAFEL